MFPPAIFTLVLAGSLIGIPAFQVAGPDGPRPNADRPVACGHFEAIDSYVEAYREMAAFDGVVLIAEGDEVVYHCAYGKADYRFGTAMRPDARFRIASLSKGFTDAAVGRLVDAGDLALDDPLSRFLPEFPNAGRITVRQLVEHTSGVPHTNRLDWMDMREPLTLDEIVGGLAEEPLDFEPGTDDAYSNGGYALLAAVIQAASGRSYQRYVEEELAGDAFPSVGHEDAGEVVPEMAHRYAPGPIYGDRMEARTYVVANRIGGGSLHADARDLWRFFRAAYGGELLESETTSELFPGPSDGDVRITGRSPGALTQVYMDFESGLSVLTLSSNSGWPGSFNADLVSLFRGEGAALEPFEIDLAPIDPEAARRHTGVFENERFGWTVRIEPGDRNFVFVQDDLRTAFAKTRDGAFHLPIYDWLCDFEADGSGFTCRQRDPDADIRFEFGRLS